MKPKFASYRFLLSLLLVFLAGCANIATYDQAAYANVVALKVDTLALMDSATDSYESQRRQIAALQRQMAKAYEYDRGRPLNDKTMQMWAVLLTLDPEHPESGLWPRFLELWRTKGTLSRDFVAGKKENISTAFDQIIELESGKNRPS